MKSFKIFGKSVPVLALVLLAMVATVAAVTMFYSAPVTVTVSEHEEPHVPVYALTLNAPSSCYVGDTIYITGTLTKDSSPVEGAAIGLYDAAGVQVAGSNGVLTNAGGDYTITWIPTAASDYIIRAGFDKDLALVTPP